jgi:hypothetical protein
LNSPLVARQSPEDGDCGLLDTGIGRERGASLLILFSLLFPLTMQAITYLLSIDAKEDVHAWLCANTRFEVRDAGETVTLRLTPTDFEGTYSLRSFLAAPLVQKYVGRWMREVAEIHCVVVISYVLSKQIGSGVLGNVQDVRVTAN